MKGNRKPRDELPEEFSSYEEAGDFWDTHDSTDYLEQLVPVKVVAHLKHRRLEIELDEDVMKALENRASSEHVWVGRLANDSLKKELVHH
jgi:hypothetical protein